MSDGESHKTDINTPAPTAEITLSPDGRVYVQGLSRELVEVLAALAPDDPHVARLVGRATAAPKEG